MLMRWINAKQSKKCEMFMRECFFQGGHREEDIAAVGPGEGDEDVVAWHFRSGGRYRLLVAERWKWRERAKW